MKNLCSIYEFCGILLTFSPFKRAKWPILRGEAQLGTKAKYW